MGPKFQQLAAGSHCKTLVRKHLSPCVHIRRGANLCDRYTGLQDVYALVSVGVCACLGLWISDMGCRHQMCVPYLCVNKESEMYTSARLYLLPGLSPWIP